MLVTDVLFVVAVVLLVAWAAVAAWVVREATAEGPGRAAKWGVTVLCTGSAGLVAYLALGSPETAARR